MAFCNNFVVSIKSNGNFLREQKFYGKEGSEVRIPFGSEYSIYLKNMDSFRKALVSVTIDGKDVLDGDKIIVCPNCFVELEGFLNGMKVSNKFKFIERTEQIEEHRGIDPEDGIVRIEYWFEKPTDYSGIIYYKYGELCNQGTSWPYKDIPRSIGTTTYTLSNSVANGYSVSCDYTTSLDSHSQSDDTGITVHGDSSSQRFSQGYIKSTEERSSVICIVLKGEINSKKVETAVYTKTPIKCPTCGKVNKSFSRFCSNCGTCLT